MSTCTAGEVIKSVASETGNLPILGSMAWWSIESSMEILLDDLAKEFTHRGIPAQWLPEQMTAKNAFTKVARQIEAEARSMARLSSIGHTYLMRKATDDTESCTMVLLHEVREKDAKDVRHETVAKIEMSKNQNDPVWNVPVCSVHLVHGAAIPEAAELEIGSIFSRHMNPTSEVHNLMQRLTHVEIRSLLARIIHHEMQGTSVRDKGGVYFVPQGSWHNHLDSIADVITFFSAGSSSVNICPIADLSRVRSSLFKAMQEEMHKDLNQLEAEIIQSTKEADTSNGKQTTMRSNTLKQKIKEFSHLRHKAVAYSDLMQASASDITERIALLEKRVLSLM